MTEEQAINELGPADGAQERHVQAEPNWLGIVGPTGRQTQSCALALGLDVAGGSALLSTLRTQMGELPAGSGQGNAPVRAALEPVAEAIDNGGAMSQATLASDAAPYLPALLSHFPRLHIVAFYLSPWEAFLDACEEGGDADTMQIRGWLHAWADCHRALLQARIAAPDRVHLINAGRLDHLDGLKERLRQMDLPMPEQAAAPESTVVGPLPNPSLSCLVASHMAETGREYWGIYEALESCCVLYEREPEFQATAELVDVQDLSSTLASFCKLHRTLAADDAAITTPWAAAHAGPDEARATSLIDEVQRENELLVLQLHQLYDELDYHVACTAELRQIVSQSGEAAEAARRLIAQLASSKDG